MKRILAGLNRANTTAPDGLQDGVLLVRVERAQYHWHAQKPFYAFVFSVLEPKSTAGNRFSARLYCAPKTLWKLNWFLRDFGYDHELLDRDEIDDKNLIGLSGVVKITHSVVNGTSLLTLDSFAPRNRWAELCISIDEQGRKRKAVS